MFGATAFFWSWVSHGLGYGYVFLVVWVNLGFVLGGYFIFTIEYVVQGCCVNLSCDYCH